jgi:hypothetical protein
MTARPNQAGVESIAWPAPVTLRLGHGLCMRPSWPPAQIAPSAGRAGKRTSTRGWSSTVIAIPLSRS